MSDMVYQKHPLLSFIRQQTNSYAAYYAWKIGDPYIRGFHMKECRRDWEWAAALYKHYRRRNVVWSKRRKLP